MLYLSSESKSVGEIGKSMGEFIFKSHYTFQIVVQIWPTPAGSKPSRADNKALIFPNSVFVTHVADIDLTIANAYDPRMSINPPE